MRLADLDPNWMEDHGRMGVGLAFTCPCGCGLRNAVGLQNPIDGGPPVVITRDLKDRPTWWRLEGSESWDTVTITPSIVVWRDKKEHWHGIVCLGDVATCR